MQNAASRPGRARFRDMIGRLVPWQEMRIPGLRSHEDTATVAAYVVGFLLLALLQYALWFGTGGILNLVRLKREIAAQQTQNASMQTGNRALAAKVLDLRQGLASVQDLARSQLGMVKKGETFYQVIQQRGAGGGTHH